MVTMLVHQLRRSGEGWSPNITESLLNEVLMAGLNAPAFSERQRWELRHTAEDVGEKIRLSPLTACWPFEVLCRKAGSDEDVVEVSLFSFSDCCYTLVPVKSNRP